FESASKADSARSPRVSGDAAADVRNSRRSMDQLLATAGDETCDSGPVATRARAHEAHPYELALLARSHGASIVQGLWPPWAQQQPRGYRPAGAAAMGGCR